VSFKVLCSSDSDLLIHNKTSYLRHTAEPEYLVTEKELLTKLMEDKENIIRIKEGETSEVKVVREKEKEKH
jgi:hypothetical protein